MIAALTICCARRAAVAASSVGRLSRARLASTVAATTSVASDAAGTAASHPAFDLVSTETVTEYNVTALLYRHKQSGAEVLSVLAPQDDNKVFGANFATPPVDSTGAPHILEHSVLCGSRKYTSKEPFVELLKGSLHTFLNAFTYPDRTCYPVASQNQKDFYNLVNVYLDAVLHPRALTDSTVLAQEGWHLELDDLADPLTYKGVVFNEMKGVYSDPLARLGRASQRALFPDTTYGVDSGGDPEAITDLSFADFVKFHRSFYHPSNAKLFFYGDDDPAQRLELLDSYLAEFDLAQHRGNGSADLLSPVIATQPLLSTPRHIVEYYPTSGEEAAEDGGEAGEAIDQEGEDVRGKHMMQVGWLMHEAPLTPKQELALAALDHLLMGTTTSTLYKALMESGLGEAVTGGGLGDHLKQATFEVGLKGVTAGDVKAVEELVLATLKGAAESGFEDDAVEAALNTMEFRLREFNTGSFPKGLSLMLAVLPKWIYHHGAGAGAGAGDGKTRSPVDALRFETPLKELRADLTAGKPVFEELLRTMLVENQHRVAVELRPDSSLEATLLEREKAKLAEIKQGMSSAELADVVEATAALKAAQLAEDSPEDLATIPSLDLTDLTREVKVTPREFSPLPGTDGGLIVSHSLPTAGIVYADVGVDLSAVPVSELPLVPLFTSMLLRVGTSSMSPEQLQRRIGARTGGIGASTFSRLRAGDGSRVSDPEDVVYKLMLRGKAVGDRADELFGLMGDVLTDARLDSQARAVEILRQSKASLESAFVSSGNSFAARRLGATSSFAGYLSEITGGVTYYHTVSQLLDQAQNDWPSLLARLEALRATMLHRDELIVNLSADVPTLGSLGIGEEGSGAVQQTNMSVLHDFAARIPLATSESTCGVPETERHTGCTSRGQGVWDRSTRLRLGSGGSSAEGFAVTTQVNYVVHSVPMFAPGEEVDGGLSVVSRLISSGFLWDHVRVAGGAYGGGCSLSLATGNLVFSSYRDPNLEQTLETYARAADVAEELSESITDEALHQAIIGTVGGLDAPMSVDQQGYNSLAQHLTGITTEQRQRYRDEVLATNRSTFRQFADRLRHATDAATDPIPRTCVFASASAFEEANAQRDADARFVVTELG